MSRLRRRALTSYNRTRARVRNFAERPDSIFEGVSRGTEGFGELPQALVHFANGPRDLYQLRPWLPVFERMTPGSVGVLARHPESFDILGVETSIPIFYIRRFQDMAARLQESSVRLLLYVNHSTVNYQPLRFSSVLHVHIGHGESDKVYMASNQSKAYDRILVAGDAAVDRLTVNLLEFDERKLLKVGRPQLDLVPDLDRSGNHVVYAPTYEGDIPGMRYTSVDTYADLIVRQILDEPNVRLTYRPHPLIGVHDAEVRQADLRIRSLLERAGDRHRVDSETPVMDLLASTDVMITDVSAMVLDSLATGIPYFVTMPRSPQASLTPGASALDAGYRIDDGNVDSVAHRVMVVLGHDDKVAERQAWAEYHFGSEPSGSLIPTFEATLRTLVEKSGRLLESRSLILSSGRARPRLKIAEM